MSVALGKQVATWWIFYGSRKVNDVRKQCRPACPYLFCCPPSKDDGCLKTVSTLSQWDRSLVRWRVCLHHWEVLRASGVIWIRHVYNIILHISNNWTELLIFNQYLWPVRRAYTFKFLLGYFTLALRLIWETNFI